MEEVIKQAIKEKAVLMLDYHPGVRFIEPHCLGYGRDGDMLLRAYQRSGASASNEPNDWKLFKIKRVSALKKTEDDFSGPRQKYNPNDSAMKGGIIERL